MEDNCCAALDAAVRHGQVLDDDGEYQIADERGEVVLYDVRHCPFCGEGLDAPAYNPGYEVVRRARL